MKKNEKINNVNTKNALILSILLILISVFLLVGSTFAWFTDSAVSGRNKIVSGNLDVDIEYALLDAARDGEGNILESEWKKVDADASIFKSADDTLWEPGHTEIAYLRIKNTGNLALKYDFAIDAYGTVEGGTEKEYTNNAGNKFKLSEYLVLNQTDTVEFKDRTAYWIVDDPSTTDVDEELAAMGKLSSSSTQVALEPGKSTVLTLAVYMPTKVGNEANQSTAAIADEGKPELYFGITITASQAEKESDTFGTDYDKNAK